MESLGILGPNLLFQIVNFLIVLYVLNRFLYRPILRLLADRQERIRQGLDAAELARQEAEQERQRLLADLESERRQSQERLRAAVQESEIAARARLQEASAEAERMLAEASREAEALRQRALQGMRGDIADLALLAAAKVLGDGLDEAKQRALIDRFLEEQLGGGS